MASAGLAGVPEQGTVLDPLVRHVDPALIHEHLHATCAHAVKRRAAIPVVAAACAHFVQKMRIDVVSPDRQRQAGDENNGYQGSS
jgi:hypothetical protein